MTDNIKMPPLPPWMERYEIPDDALEGGSVNLDSRMRSYAREAVRLNAQGVPDEPDWRHPKIQGLIGSEARLRITINLIWQILEDPNQEFGPSDMEYWDTIHDKLKEALSTEPAPPQPAQQPLTDEKDILRMAREQGLPETETEGVFRVNADDLGRLLAAEREAMRLNAQAAPEGWKLVPVDALKRWRDAFAEELSAWDIDPPIHHVQTSHDEIEAVLSAAPAPPQPAHVDIDALEEALASLEFYKRRCNALQTIQRRMRDPERQIVCDILANGMLLDPPGDRYKLTAQQPLTDKQIHKLLTDADEGQEPAEYAVAVIRAVEQAHGIGVKND